METFEPRPREKLLELLGRFSASTAEWERREFATLPKDTQALVLHRLDVLDRYLALSKPKVSDADAAAEAISIPRSNFYRMLSRYKEGGAVLGLVPHARVKRPAMQAGKAFEADLTRLVREHPTERLAFFEKALEAVARKHGTRPPSRVTIQRRIAELRATTAAPPHARSSVSANPVFGRQLLVDQCLLGVPVADDASKPRLGIAVVLDVDTRLLLGVGLGPAGLPQKILAGAVADTDAFWEERLLGSFPTRALPERVEWVPPPGGDAAVAGFVDRARAWDIAAVVDGAPDRRHGARLEDFLGRGFGGYSLIPYSGDADVVDVPDIPPEPLITVAGTLARAVEEWNMEIVRRRQKARLVLRGATWDKRLEQWRSTKRASDLDGGEIAMLLSGRGLPAWAADFAARTIWRRWEESRPDGQI